MYELAKNTPDVLENEVKRLKENKHHQHLENGSFLEDEPLLNSPIGFKIDRHPEDKEQVAGTILKAEHFLRFLRKVVKCLKDELKDVSEPKIITPLQLFNKM